MKKIKLLVVAGIFLLACYFLISKDFDKNEAIIYTNGNFITLDKNLPKATAIFVEDGKIIDIGNSTTLQENHPTIKTIDLKGATVLPGFIDSHTHVALSAFFNDMIDLSGFVDRLHNERLSQFQNDASRKLGKPRISSQQVSHLVRKEPRIDPLALAMVVFTGQRRPLIAKLGAHWEMDNIIWDMSPTEIYEWAKEPEKQEEPMAEEPIAEKPKESFWKGFFD